MSVDGQGKMRAFLQEMRGISEGYIKVVIRFTENVMQYYESMLLGGLCSVPYEIPAKW